MKDKSPATIYDVARKAGVSTATVSRLLNDATSVREATRTRVLQAIEELQYVPQRGGRPRSTDRLPAVLARPPVAFLKVGDFYNSSRSPITTQLIEEIRKAAETNRLPFQVVDVPQIDPGTPVQEIVGKEVKGVFLRTSNLHDVTKLSADWLKGMPAVQVLGENEGSQLWMDHLTPDHVSVGLEAAQYLIQHDCDRLVFAGSGGFHRLNLDRCSAFVNMGQRAGKEVYIFHQAIPGKKVELERMLSSLPTAQTTIVESRQELIQTIVTGMTDKPFGLFVPSDMLLMILLSQLQMMGREHSGVVPAIGCNRETRAFLELDTSPATFDLQMDVLADQAVHRLLRRIQEPDKPFMRIAVAPRLIPAES